MMPLCGVVKAGERVNVQVTFTPAEEVSYPKNKVAAACGDLCLGDIDYHNGPIEQRLCTCPRICRMESHPRNLSEI